ncbi:NAD(P)H-quinone dehydrogenase [Arsenicicoccus dermatophilus]|uniref:NAD(P)H-quinone dehydrogenase n=1 Tax=Arsenicicoccus dermatophilus TaxID=1076331 RepID=UPI0039174027
MIERNQSVVILGGGPGGYEAALVAAQLGATVTVVDRDGLGGAAVLTDCVPSKALISTASFMTRMSQSRDMGVHLEDPTTGQSSDLEADDVAVADLPEVNARILRLAVRQSQDIEARLLSEGITVVKGVGRLVAPGKVSVTPVVATAPEHVTEEDQPGVERDHAEEVLDADVVLVSVGATPRVLASARPDGERILTWKQIWALPEVPEHLVVVGSGVTGAELAHAYLALGSKVTLISSRDHVLPGEDPDAARVIEDVFRRRGMVVLNRSRAETVERVGDRVVATLTDGRTVEGSHCIMAVGSVPATEGLGLAECGVQLTGSGHIEVDRVSRTSVNGIYAAGDCTAALPLASVAAMQGRTAMWHALGDAVQPLNLHGVSATIFTDPEIATVGVSAKDIADQELDVREIMMPLDTNPRSKMDQFTDGFVKLYARKASGLLMGGVVVAPKASELIFPVALAVENRLTVDQVAHTFTVYPSMTGSIAEAARRLHTAE